MPALVSIHAAPLNGRGLSTFKFYNKDDVGVR